MLRALLIWLALASTAVAEAIPAGFNDKGIQWLKLDEGLERAASEGKPVLVVVHATWCPRCREYSEQFFDERVEVHAEDVVFVLIDQDKEEASANRFVADGPYIPRTFVLRSDGEFVPEINSQRDDYQYYLHTLAPDDLLRVLSAAVALR